MSVLGQLLHTIDDPARTMRGATERPRSWWVPALLVIAALGLLSWVAAPYRAEQANAQQAQLIERIAQGLPEDQARVVRESVREVTPTTQALAALGTGALLAGLGWVARATVVHFSSMAAGGSSVWGGTFAATLWAVVPYAVRDVTKAVHVLVTRGVPAHEGLSFLVASGDLLADLRNPLYTALSYVDPFDLWHIVLLAVAIAVATRVRGFGALVMAAIVWAVFLGIKVLPAVIGAAAMGGLMG